MKKLEPNEHLIIVTDEELLAIEQILEPPLVEVFEGIPQGSPSAFDSSNLTLFDDFNVVVNRADTDADTTFVANGPWTHVKAWNSNFGVNPGDDSGAGGYIYTVDSIEGFTGSFPNPSSRAACVEHRPDLHRANTDLYFAYESGQAGFFPTDNWIQFWIYIQDDAGSGKQSQPPAESKFGYFCSELALSTCSVGNLEYLLVLDNKHGSASFPFPYYIEDTNYLSLYPNPQSLSVDLGFGDLPRRCYWHIADDSDYTTYSIQKNAWYLVTVNYDHSGSTVIQKTWLKRQDWANHVKVGQWVDGANNNVTGDPISFPSTLATGHSWLKFPEFAWGTGYEATGFAWYYFQDFQVGGSNNYLKNPIPAGLL